MASNKLSIKNRLVAGIALMLAASSSLWADTLVSSDSLRYHLSSDGKSVELTYLSYDSTNVQAYVGDVIVPSQVTLGGHEYAVTGVTPFACVFCDSLLSVSLPEGVSRIGFGAFSDCPQLAEVSLPSTLTTLSDWAFYRDAQLQGLALPKAVKRVGACSFAFCSSLDSLSMPMGLRAIGQNAFYYCSSLSEVYLPGTVMQIGEYAFAYNASLAEIRTDGAPVAITPDVFEGVDVTQVRLVVPTDQVEAFQTTEVWCDFQIVDGGYEGIRSIFDDEPNGFSYRVEGETLILNVSGDAPALVYDLRGRRIAVAASHSGETRFSLAREHYIIKCGRESVKIAL